VLADRHGNCVHLGERECSVQRRSQKLIEESPSVAVDLPTRQALGEAAVAIAREAGYENAGTVEFLMDAEGSFYFIEANARLQVEHPVTELVTGLDLVQEQLLVAAGEPLSFRQADVELRGWAIECRITAEDAAAGFLPSLGRVAHVSEPSGPGVRVESSLFSGMEVGPYYDSLVAKLCVWGGNREQALARLRRALDEYTIAGVKTTLPFHRQLVDHPDFIAGNLHTRFLDRNPLSLPDAAPAGDEALLAGALLSHVRKATGQTATGSGAQANAWRAAGRGGAVDRGGGASWRDTF
jgi:acetyl-CoA carboxylase biotin carboxylase subunit